MLRWLIFFIIVLSLSDGFAEVKSVDQNDSLLALEKNIAAVRALGMKFVAGEIKKEAFQQQFKRYEIAINDADQQMENITGKRPVVDVSLKIMLKRWTRIKELLIDSVLPQLIPADVALEKDANSKIYGEDVTQLLIDVRSRRLLMSLRNPIWVSRLALQRSLDVQEGVRVDKIACQILSLESNRCEIAYILDKEGYIVSLSQNTNDTWVANGLSKWEEKRAD